uniref:Uncharacterized protein n=1 Tax=Rhizophora mucronata TaxID=61149 RepID=A0A2P2ISY8_RHIMU
MRKSFWRPELKRLVFVPFLTITKLSFIFIIHIYIPFALLFLLNLATIEFVAYETLALLFYGTADVLQTFSYLVGANSGNWCCRICLSILFVCGLLHIDHHRL